MKPEDIKITAEPSASHEATCSFIVDRPVYPGGAVHFSRLKGAEGSPLAETFFNHEELDVTEVLIAENTVTITLASPPPGEWREEAVTVATAIREQLCSRVAAVSEQIKENFPPEQ